MVATRTIVRDVSPGSLAFLRYVLSSACLVLAYLLRRRVRLPWRDAFTIGVLGALQFAAVVVLLNVALQRIPAARAALLFSLSPVLTLLLEAAHRKRAPSAVRSVGAVLAIVGVAVTFGWDALSSGGRLLWAGEGASLLAALLAAVCALGYRPHLARYGALTVAAYALPPAVAVLLGAALLEGFFARPLALSASG